MLGYLITFIAGMILGGGMLICLIALFMVGDTRMYKVIKTGRRKQKMTMPNYINAKDLMREVAYYCSFDEREKFKRILEKIKPVNMLDRDVGMEPLLEDKTSVVHSDFADGSAETKVNNYKAWTCPKCGWFVGELYCGYGRYHVQKGVSYCSQCGQKIDWTKPLAEERERREKHDKLGKD